MSSEFKRKYVPRKLGERSNLRFEFPQEDGRAIIAILPMLENCSISESKKSNLASYDLIGRSGNLFAYLGAKSREFTLRFNITMLHVIEMYNLGELPDDVHQLYTPLLSTTRDRQRLKFFVEDRSIPVNESGKKHSSIHRQMYKDLAGLSAKEGLNFFDRLINLGISNIGNDQKTKGDNFRYDQLVKNAEANTNELDKIIDYIVFWINLVRASGMNNSKTSSLGPPIVRINHGIMYNNIPCVAESSNVRAMEEHGYDMQTMLPRRIEISMNLTEVRTGNFGEFKAGQVVDGDNNTGWESVISDNNIDPYNSGNN